MLLAILLTVLCVFFLMSVVSVYQEQKIWKDPNLEPLSPWGMFKVLALNMVWLSGCCLGVLCTPIYWLFVGGLSNWNNSKSNRKWAHTYVERNCAKFAAYMSVGPVEVRGMEHIPVDYCHQSPAPIFVANHASQLDLAVTYFLDREWRWIAKASIRLLPGVGQTMALADHVFIDRPSTKRKKPSTTTATSTDTSNAAKNSKAPTSKTGSRNLYLKSNASIQEGIPMFIFPQGTRRWGERLPFKDGAFKIALESKAPLVPVSIDFGPSNPWNSFRFFPSKISVVLTVHPPVDVHKGSSTATEPNLKSLDELKTETYETIYSVLPDFSKQS